MSLRKGFFILISLFLLHMPLSGCVSSIHKNHKELEARAKKLKSIKLLSAEVKISELSAGGVSELRDDWSEAGRQNTEKAIMDVLNEKKVRVSLLTSDPQMKEEIEDVTALYKAVMDSIYTHAFVGQGNPNIFPDKLNKFDYSIGSLEKVLSKQNSDGLLIIFGEDEISSAGRKALRVVQAINIFAQAQQSGVTYMQAALVDKSGDILWFNSFAEAGGYDLRKYVSARDFIKVVLNGYPGGS